MKSTKEMTTADKRKYLRELSAKATAIKEKMLHNCKNDEEIQVVNALTINQIIIENFYKDAENTDFMSFKGWIQKGKTVRKGETAFLLWGKPTERKDDGTIQPISEDEEGNMFYPLSFVFSNKQVHTLEKETA